MKSHTCSFTGPENLLQPCSANGGIKLLNLMYRHVFCITTQKEKAINFNNSCCIWWAAFYPPETYRNSARLPRVLSSLEQLLLTVSSMNAKPKMAEQTSAILGQPPSFPGGSSLEGGWMGQTGLCPRRARQAAFPEEQTNLSVPTQQCYLASSGKKCTHSDNLGEFQVLKVSSIVRQIFK